ncbi:hypothetical protein LOTGIDRAFT_165094 [Lottia gigantea]|uniref:Uncharacterized protein n=1 Tax=Lottia gigantea TaxID=225164 RepID=V4A3I1_LOTGI|nr:hypothetical protein LOTGIDRAFT_165094 [Lottia gigantea]ESO89500.1 hypothetical protein LOTGIDRAFT_165094 [Lottia gigantea]
MTRWFTFSGNERDKRAPPQIEVACTIYTLAKSCTEMLKDCGPLCATVETSCARLSKMSKVAAIACDDKDSMTESMEFFKDSEVAKANGIKDTEKFWEEVEKDPLKVVQEVVAKIIANGGLQMSPDQFLGSFDTGIGGASTSLTNNALGNAVNKEALDTAGKVIDGSLTGEDLVDSGKAIGEGIGQGAKDLANDAKNTFDELTDVDLNNIDDKLENVGNKALDTAKGLVDDAKNALNSFGDLFINLGTNLRQSYLLLPLCIFICVYCMINSNIIYK